MITWSFLSSARFVACACLLVVSAPVSLCAASCCWLVLFGSGSLLEIGRLALLAGLKALSQAATLRAVGQASSSSKQAGLFDANLIEQIDLAACLYGQLIR